MMRCLIRTASHGLLVAALLPTTGARTQADERQADSGTSDSPTTVNRQAAESPAEILLHENGSATVTLDGKAQLLPPRLVRAQLPKLLKGRTELILRMDDWSKFETVDVLRDLYEAGIRKLTLAAVVNGKEEVRTVELQPPPLDQRILQGTAETRRKALAELEAQLQSDGRGDRVNALYALQRAAQVRFDRARYLPLVRRSLDAGDVSELGAAIGAIVIVGGDAADIPKVVAHVDHESPRIRAALCSTLVRLDPQGKHSEVGAAIVKLLNDSESFVRTATFKSLWGAASTPEIDERLIELSRGPSKGGSSEADEVVYYALSTRPLVRSPVAERLVQIIGERGIYSSRAVWGLSHHAAEDGAHARVVAALIQVFDGQTDETVRRDALYGLGYHGGDKALKKLNAVVADDNQSPSLREYAFRQLRGRNAPGEESPAPAKPAPAQSAKPQELWEQIVQSQDAALRAAALASVEKLLADETTAAQGLATLLKAAQAPFDRAPIVRLATPLMSSENAELRAMALGAIVALDPNALDVAAVAAHRDDPSPRVRQAVAESIVRCDPEGVHVATHRTIELLLADADSQVVQSMIRSLWGRPTTPHAEEMLIDLSYGTAHGDDAIYYALSTRPLIREPVAARLIELTSFTHRYRGRAIWGLSHHAIDESANDLVADALIDIVDTTTDGYDRTNAIKGLGQLRGLLVRERLE
jgi:hypothetical protein